MCNHLMHLNFVKENSFSFPHKCIFIMDKIRDLYAENFLEMKILLANINHFQKKTAKTADVTRVTAARFIFLFIF